MGDRAVIYVEGAACSLYLHWGGSEVPQLLRDFCGIARGGDPDYAQARLIGLACVKYPGLTGVGVLPAPKEGERPRSHGDAGVFTIHPLTGQVTASDGYGWGDSDPVRVTWGDR